MAEWLRLVQIYSAGVDGIFRAYSKGSSMIDDDYSLKYSFILKQNGYWL